MKEIAPTYRLSDLINCLEIDYRRKATARSSGLAVGPISGLKKLDAELGGCLAPGLHILQGAPGTGKTALGLYISAHCGGPALYVSAEQPPLQLFLRHIARDCGLALSKLDLLSWEELRHRAVQTAKALPLLCIVDATACRATTPQLGEELDRLRSEAHDRTPLVVVDSLQVWSRHVSYATTEYEIISQGVKALAELAQAKGVPVLGITHRNRAGQDRGGLFASKGSGDIEYAAESLLELAMPENPRTTASGEIELSITIHKNRHGAPGAIVKVRFNPALQGFSAVDR